MTDIPHPRNSTTFIASTRLHISLHIALASLTGLGLRLMFVLRFPLDAGDTGIYEELARNWLDAHVYGLVGQNGLQSSDIRGPGYPAFLSLVYLLLGRGQVAILLAQAAVDLCTCYLVAWLAALLVPEARRRRVGLAALWLAVTCPLVANYSAVPLTEVLATFLTAAALVAVVSGLISDSDGPDGHRRGLPFFLGGFFVGLGTLVRPETPLLLVALAVVLVVRWRQPDEWAKLLRVGLLAAAGLALPLVPWAARNWVRFHEVQFLAPRFAAAPGEFVPRGFYAWTGTWLTRYRDVYLVPWRVDGERIEPSQLSPAAYDSPEERARVVAQLDTYNRQVEMSPEIDRGFAELAQERTARRPLRTYLWVPLERIATMWFTPRTELLPISGHVRPFAEQWREDRRNVIVTLLWGALNFFYVGLAWWGLRRAWRLYRDSRMTFPTALIFLLVFIATRSIFLSTVETPEPRYVLECFPALLAFGALAWLPKTALRAARDES